MSSGIKPFSEKQVRKKIIEKVKPKILKGRSKHSKGLIFLDDKVVAKVKIPNSHDKMMFANKSRFIARDLRLNPSEFNDLIDCPLSGPGYYEILSTRIKA
ncbi:MAG: hypothetical protein KAW12_13025 [Candidatus Aminicenantes bacterium]|nr:hypothetical protein [Candidatus Aminicenantes bacterium]